MEDLIDKLYAEHNLSKQEWVQLIENYKLTDTNYLFKLSRELQQKYYGNKVYARGLIEISNYCRNDCYYCGIRKSNKKVERYHLSKDEILECCHSGYELGFRTFVLQGGEDASHTDDWLVELVTAIRGEFKDCATTLSLGERDRKSYEKLYQAGANRYLLRHETADYDHYNTIHPEGMSGEYRQKCLYDLKDIGYQAGTGFMVGVKGQTPKNLADDMIFIHRLKPHMVGIGPFVPHHETPFGKEPGGTVELTLFMIGLLRLMLPKVLLPSTTALGTIHKNGRGKGILAGANVVMPNLTPVKIRGKYELYDNKLSVGAESAEGIKQLEDALEKIGYVLSFERGDHPDKTKK